MKISETKTQNVPPNVGSLPENARIFLGRVVAALRLVPARYAWRLVAAALVMTVASAAGMVVALMLGRLIDQVQSGLEKQTPAGTFYPAVARILGIIAVVYIVREVLNVLRRHMVESSCTSITRHMQAKVVGHVLKARLDVLALEKTGGLHGKIFRSVDGLVHFLRLVCLDCLPAFFTGVFALTAAVAKQPILGAVMACAIPLSVWLTLRQLASQKGVRVALMRDCEEIDGMVVEQLCGTEYIRAANTLPLEMDRLSRAAGKRRGKEMRHHFQMSLYGCGKALNEGLFHVVVLAVAAYLAVNRQISFGDVLAFSVLFLGVMAPLNEIHRLIDEGQESSLRVGELFKLLDMPVDPSFAASQAVPVRLQPGRPVIEADNLMLDYFTPEGQSKRGLDGVSLRIDHGQTIGVAGPSGSGKSTLVKALLRLAHPAGGTLRVGDAALENIGREQLAGLVAYIGQAPFVFSGSVRDNIAYGNGDLSQERILRAAEMAHLRQDIAQMPHGFDTQVLERGQNISGGQRQRLAIARILVKDAPILVLDEATSALDNISERHVQEALGIRGGTRTTLIIAHRLSTLKHCDRILVFENGRIAEAGTYSDLLEKQGLFARLVASGERHME